MFGILRGFGALEILMLAVATIFAVAVIAYMS